MSGVRVVRGADLRPVSWRNGKGTTRDVLTSPAGLSDWQVSIADLERDAPFSDFSGMDRTFTIIEGLGVELVFGEAVVPCPPLIPVRFPGGAAPGCRLLGGPGRAFNVFADAGRFRSQVAALRLAPGCTLESEAGTTLIHCIAGAVIAGGTHLGAGDTLVEWQGALVAEWGAATLLQVAIAPRDIPHP